MKIDETTTLGELADMGLSLRRLAWEDGAYAVLVVDRRDGVHYTASGPTPHEAINAALENWRAK